MAQMGDDPVSGTGVPVWVQALVTQHGGALARLAKQHGVSESEGFACVEECLASFCALPQARTLVEQTDDARLLLSLMLGTAARSAQIRAATGLGGLPESPTHGPLGRAVRLMLLKSASGVADELHLSAEGRERLLMLAGSELGSSEDTPTTARPVLELTTDSLEERVAQGAPLLVHFVASWSESCRQMAALLDVLAHARQGALGVASLDVEQNPEAPGRYRVRAVPTLVLFQGGKRVDNLVGATSAVRLLGWVDPLLASG